MDVDSLVNADRVIGFVAACVLGMLYYICDWFWHVVIRPILDRRKGLVYPPERVVKEAYREKERHDRQKTRDTAPPPPRRRDPASRPVPVSGPATQDLAVTQEHPAPSTSMIDLTQPPPPLPYTGPERRRRSDNPYPELRRRAEDRERAEAEAAARPVPPPAAPRMTRAEERRRREARDVTQSDVSDTDGA